MKQIAIKNMQNKKRIKFLSSFAILLVLVMTPIGFAKGNNITPPDQRAILSVQGQGVNPYASISLSTGPQQIIQTKADSSGHFSFFGLKYYSYEDLEFTIDIPPYGNNLGANYLPNQLKFKYNGRESLARISGQIGKSGTLIFNMEGSETAPLQIAGNSGIVDVQTRTQIPMSEGQSTLVASIVNAGEICCPRMVLPSIPITLKISTLPIQIQNTAPNISVPTKATKDQSNQAPQTYDSKPMVPKSKPKYFNSPSQKSEDEQLPSNQKDNEDKPRKKIPYIIQGQIKADDINIDSEDFIAAVSFSSADFDGTYVGGIKQIANEMRNAVYLNITTIGAMLDARNLLDSLRSIQVSTVQTLKDYTTSDAVCRFGTLSRSVATADAVALKNQNAFSKILMDRDTQKKNSLYSDAGVGIYSMVNNFRDKYCEISDNNGSLEGYCKAATATSDLFFNRDVDFTRVFDIPLTFDADFTDSTPITPTNLSPDKQALIALFSNLSMVDPLMSSNGSYFDPRNNSLTTQDARSINAIRTVTANSFAALVGEKTKVTSASANYMRDMIVKLGLPAAEATKLIGANPSYFAQMEVLTKKIFQDPAFYANLYDSEANVDRQRVAMKAIELQQDRDFLESLRRREMALSVLLNAKLGKTATSADVAGFTNYAK